MTFYQEVERRHSLSYPRLEEEYLEAQRPVILTDLCRDWVAMKKWTPEFLCREYGRRRVDVYDDEFQKPNAHYLKATRSTSFGEFMSAAEAGESRERLFLFELFKMAPELRRDVALPEWMDVLSRQFLVSFFGGPGSWTTFHYDVDLPHVFHAVIYGEKEFYLFPPDQSSHLYRHPFTVRSYINAKVPDLARYPRFDVARGYRCRVKAGETLVIPSGQWHQTFYPELSWGLAFRKYKPTLVPRALLNMLAQEPLDRALTKLLGRRWFAWKEERSGARHTGSAS